MRCIHFFLVTILLSITTSLWAGQWGEYLNETQTYRLQLSDDNTYRLIFIQGKNKYGKVYDRIGYWKEYKGVLTLYFTGYDMGEVENLEVDYQGCARIEKKPIAEYKYKRKGPKLKPLNSQKKAEIFVKVD